MYLLGYDIGSSTIKAALLDAKTHKVLGLTHYPDQEMDMISRQRGWAEQQPEVWWQHFCAATHKLLDTTGVDAKKIMGIGISYQMHGLVLVDREMQVLRPSIIWCDSRAVAIGQQAFDELGEDYCLRQMLNSPGNFTASKLKWVKDNEPDIYEKAYKLLLPGDFIAMKLTGEAVTTVTGLTEGIFWDFKEKKVANRLLEHYGLRKDLLADTVPTFSIQGKLTKAAAARTGLSEGTPLSYRAGDQPNNALSLNVLRPGEVAATSGTSGVVYGIVDKPVFDKKSRVNSFAHVNYEQNHDRIGVLLCLNGAGIEYSWVKHQVARSDHSYADMERMASTVPVGSDGLCVLPFGNGAERMLEDRNVNAHFFNLDFNRHTRAHLYRASLEGVAFSFVMGVNILKELGLNVDIIRVGNDNMFQSKIFAKTISTLLNSKIEVVDTTGAVGAARAAGVATGIYANLEEALQDVKPGVIYEPNLNHALCQQAYSYWASRVQLAMEEETAAARSATPPPDARQQSKELAAAQLQLDAAHEFLAELRNMLLKQDANYVAKVVQKIEAKLDNSGREWEGFEEHFDLLHDDFIKKLKKRYPTLSMQELRLCAYLKMKLSTKEMAQQMRLSVRGVETGRYRLRRKLGMADGENFGTFLEKI